MAKKKKSDIQEYQEGLTDAAVGNMKYGMLNVLGQATFGHVGSNHPVVKPATDSVRAGLQLGQIGNLAATGLAVAKLPGTERKKKKKSKSKYEDMW